jgi:hypothetical protein
LLLGEAIRFVKGGELATVEPEMSRLRST